MSASKKYRMNYLPTAILLAWMPATISHAQSEHWNTDYISDDTFFVFAVNVEKIVDPVKDDPVFGELRQDIKRNMGFDISEVRQIQFIMGGEDEDMETDDFTVGNWQESKPITLTLKEGGNTLRFWRNHPAQYGLAIKSFALQPVQ